jgi:PilZ domain-containing protein
MVERRQHFRYAVRMNVELEWPSRDPGLSTTYVPVSDIGLGGMFIMTSEPLPLGAEFSVRLLLEKPLSLRCAVRQVVPGRGMGVEFLDLPDSSRLQLEEFLAAVAEQSLALFSNPWLGRSTDTLLI